MRRLWKIMITLILLGVLITPNAVTGNYQQIVGQTYTYDVMLCRISVTGDTGSVSSSHFVIDNEDFNEETQVEVEVTDVNATSDVYWEISSGGYTELGFSSLSNDLFYLSEYMVYPIVLTDTFGLMTWSEVLDAMSIGMNLLIIPFWDTDLLVGFENLADPDNIDELKTMTGFEDLTMKGEYTQAEGLMTFDWLLKGRTTITTPYSYDFKVEHQLKIVFDSSTGVLQGLKMTSHTDGTHTGESIKVSLDYLIEIEGYDIGDFVFDLPGFNWLLTLSTLGVLAIPILIRKYRRK